MDRREYHPGWWMAGVAGVACFGLGCGGRRAALADASAAGDGGASEEATPHPGGKDGVADAPVDSIPEDAPPVPACPAIDADPVDAGPVTDGGVLVPTGSFVMGCNADLDSSCHADEHPCRIVTLSMYEIDATEVTQAAYERCIEAKGCSPPQANFDPAAAGDLPVRDLSWAQAQEYCAWLGRRLPTEAEWEKAARGPDGRRYPWGEPPPTCELANFEGCGGVPLPVTAPTGASPYGATGMAGNVAEWVADWYAPAYYRSAPAADPPGPPGGSYRVVRGGSFVAGAAGIRVSARGAGDPALSYDDIGFRCARSL